MTLAEEVTAILSKAEKPITCPEVVRRLKERGRDALPPETLHVLELLMLDGQVDGWVDRRNTVYARAMPVPEAAP